jgi:hypothetical protein
MVEWVEIERRKFNITSVIQKNPFVTVSVVLWKDICTSKAYSKYKAEHLQQGLHSLYFQNANQLHERPEVIKVKMWVR